MLTHMQCPSQAHKIYYTSSYFFLLLLLSHEGGVAGGTSGALVLLLLLKGGGGRGDGIQPLLILRQSRHPGSGERLQQT